MSGEASKWGVLVEDDVQDYFTHLVQYQNNGSKRNRLGEAANEAAKLKLAYEFATNPDLYEVFTNLPTNQYDWLDEEIDEEKLDEMIEPYLHNISTETQQNPDSQSESQRSEKEITEPMQRLVMAKMEDGRYEEAISDMALAYDLESEELLHSLYEQMISE